MPSSHRVLLLALATKWIGAARLPGAMKRAGFDVGVLAPRGSLIVTSRHIDRRGEMPSGVDVAEVCHAIWHFVTEWGASSIVPTDDRAAGFMMDFAEAVFGGKFDGQPGHDVFAAALKRSLPPAGHFRNVRLKSASHAAAVAMGITAPPQIVGPSVDAARDFAGHCGYPIVAKLDLGSAGAAVRICDDAASLDRVVGELSRAATETNKLLLERFIEGPGYLRPLVAADGKILAAFTIERVQRHPEPLGPSTVVRVVDVSEIEQFVEQFVANTRYNGFAMPEFIVERTTGRANWIEFNCRPAPQTHFTEEMVGVDLCRAWHAYITGRAVPGYRPSVGQTIAMWPQEWLRDPQSPLLLPDRATQDPLDDDLALLAAYTTLKA